MAGTIRGSQPRAARHREAGAKLAGAVVAALLALCAVAAQAADPSLTAFRPCIDPSNLPFANDRGEGFENRIADLFAAKLGVPVRSYSFPQRMNFVRNTLRYKLPGQDFRCDVMMGVPSGYEQVSATKPYYRSTYVLVYRKGRDLDAVKRGADLFALDPGVQKRLRIGIYDRSPASMWLVKHGWEDRAKVYRMMSPDPEEYPGEIIERDLARGDIDAAVVWGPIGGYYAKRVTNVELEVVPLKSEPGVKFDYEIAMGVRFGEPEWKSQVEKLIADNRGEILAILREYNVPLVDDAGDPIK
jgi:quinoprotein dehydrogenase-associated probable ABC transporter substrate-binding protein